MTPLADGVLALCRWGRWKGRGKRMDGDGDGNKKDDGMREWGDDDEQEENQKKQKEKKQRSKKSWKRDEECHRAKDDGAQDKAIQGDSRVYMMYKYDGLSSGLQRGNKSKEIKEMKKY